MTGPQGPDSAQRDSLVSMYWDSFEVSLQKAGLFRISGSYAAHDSFVS